MSFWCLTQIRTRCGQLKQARRDSPFTADRLVLMVAGGPVGSVTGLFSGCPSGLSRRDRGGGGAHVGGELHGHGGCGLVGQSLAHPGPTVGADVPDGLGQRPAGIDHLADGLGFGRSGSGLTQAGDGGGFIDQAVGEVLAEGLGVEIGSGIPDGQRPGELFRLGVRSAA